MSRHLALSVFRLNPFSCHTPATNHIILLLSFLERPSICNILPQEKFLYLVLISFSLKILLKYFVFQYHCICLSLSLSFLSILCSSSFNSTIQLLTLVLIFCHSQHCVIGPSIFKHIFRYQCFKICLTHSLPRSDWSAVVSCAFKQMQLHFPLLYLFQAMHYPCQCKRSLNST